LVDSGRSPALVGEIERNRISPIVGFYEAGFSSMKKACCLVGGVTPRGLIQMSTWKLPLTPLFEFYIINKVMEILLLHVSPRCLCDVNQSMKNFFPSNTSDLTSATSSFYIFLYNLPMLSVIRNWLQRGRSRCGAAFCQTAGK